MYTNTEHKKKHNSLRALVLYSVLVIFVIVVALTVKTISVWRQSKYDGQHYFTVAIGTKNRLAEIVAFDPNASSIMILKVSGKPVPLDSIGKDVGFVTDASINTSFELDYSNTLSRTLTTIALQYKSAQKDLSIIDILRLVYLSKQISLGNQKVKQITLPTDNQALDKTFLTLFMDSVLSSENVSIQIINQTDIPGFGNRLGRVLTNMGGNVVAISSDQTTSDTSRIEYYGKDTYTLQKIEKMLGYKTNVREKQTIADIIIYLGKDSANTNKF